MEIALVEKGKGDIKWNKVIGIDGRSLAHTVGGCLHSGKGPNCGVGNTHV